MKALSFLKPIYLKLNTIENRFYRILEKFVTALMLIVTLDVIYQVFYRTVLVKIVSISSIFTEEFARYGIIWIMFLLLPICIKEGRFAAVTLVIEKSSPKRRLFLYIVDQILQIAFVSVSFVYAIRFVKSNLLFTSPAMRLPGIYVYVCIPIGMALCFFQMVIEFIGVLSGEALPFDSLLSTEGKGGAD